jgi:hypothetical protein
MDVLLPLIQGLVDKYPVLATIIFGIGVLRVCLKPLMSVLRAVAEFTESPKDNAKLDEVEASTFYKSLLYILDWFTSIKLPIKPSPVPEQPSVLNKK